MHHSFIANTTFSSRFESALRTNYATDPKESEELLHLLQQPRQRLVDLDNSIARLESDLATLKAQRNALHGRIDAHLALLSPIRRLPEDVLREIFLHCLDTYPVRSTKHAPLLLTVICRDWRRIALETPRLWCSIHIYIPKLRIQCYGPGDSTTSPTVLLEEDRSLVERRIAGIQTWLDRSGSVPIYFSIACSGLSRMYSGVAPVFPEDGTAALKSVIGTFLRYRSRWKCARLSGLYLPFLAPILSLKPEEIPKLETLLVSVVHQGGLEVTNSDTSGASLLNRQNSILQAPSLRQLHLSLPRNVQHDIKEFPIRWNQLTELSLHCQADARGISWTTVNALTILDNVKGTIRKFSASWVQVPLDLVDYPEAFGFTSLELPVLETLALTMQKVNMHEQAAYICHDDISTFFSFLSCPSLKELTLLTDSSWTGDGIDTNPLDQFIRQSRCRLTSFTTDLHLSMTAFRDCLHSMPMITKLTYSEFNSAWPTPGFGGQTRSVLEALTADDNVLVCPTLQHIALSSVNPHEAELVVGLARRRLGHHLKSLRVYFNGPVNEEYRPKVKSLREQGLEVKWVFQGSIPREVPRDRPDEGLPSSGIAAFPHNLQSEPGPCEY